MAQLPPHDKTGDSVGASGQKAACRIAGHGVYPTNGEPFGKSTAQVMHMLHMHISIIMVPADFFMAGSPFMQD